MFANTKELVHSTSIFSSVIGSSINEWYCHMYHPQDDRDVFQSVFVNGRRRYYIIAEHVADGYYFIWKYWFTDTK